MQYILFSHLVIMGIQAYLFSKKNKKNKNDNQIIELNKTLSDMYFELKQEQENFDKLREANDNIHAELNSKKVEVQNRLDYLEGIRNQVGGRFQDKSTSIKDFNELCKKFVSAHDDVEKVQIEIHHSEIEFEKYLQTWDEELKKHNEKVAHLRKEIECVLSDISVLKI
jgi:predicted  nucleic acid-binding Zn-ribbon protein